MPVIKVKTVQSKVGWTNPSDPSHKSYDLQVEVEGKRVEVRTFSEAVSKEGYEGEVETYEKGGHTYLKPVRNDNWGGGNYQKANSGYGNRGGGNNDRSDGQRQGMCVNNAANFINGLHSPSTNSPSAEEWARQVHEYASALYALGDLSKKDTVVTDVPDEQVNMDDVENLFGGK